MDEEQLENQLRSCVRPSLVDEVRETTDPMGG